MSDNMTALHTARSTLGAVRQLLEQLDHPELVISARVAEVQVEIGEKLGRLYSKLDGNTKDRWQP